MAGLVRLVHPFPSLLDGLVVAGSALAAGADVPTAVRLGASMTALQVSIGALNDLVDAPRDRGHKPGKPIPAGLISPGAARSVVVLAAAAGLVLAAPSGPGTVALGFLVLSVGAAYDLWAKGTAWSWVPFAVGIPLLPVYGWVGATQGLASWFVALVPMAAVAGAAVAVGNARADLERDEGTGTATVATLLGLGRSWWVLVGLWVTTGTIAVVSAVALGGSSAHIALVLAGLVIVLAGTLFGWRGDPARRERSWELQAIGAAVTGVAWIIAVA